MSNAENGQGRQEDKVKLVEVEKGLFVIDGLTRNPPEEAKKLISEIEELAKKLHR